MEKVNKLNGKGTKGKVRYKMAGRGNFKVGLGAGLHSKTGKPKKKVE